VTFTNKAAREMEARIVQLLRDMGVPLFEPMWINTFHSSCARILREEIHLLGYQPFFGIYDDSDQLTMIKKVMTILNINDKIHPPKSFQSRINEAKRLALSPEDISRKAKHFLDERSQQVYKIYEEEMKKANALDFGDLLYKTFDLFQMYPDVLDRYRDRFQHIMVDEYQDTNHIQYRLVKMLSEKHQNICVVGDEDQSIYSWRGADISNILDFEKDFPSAKVVKLEENYRSTKNIVTAASEVIRNNSQRKVKTLFTQNDTGELITIREEPNEYEEARFVVKSIEDRIQSDGATPQDFAIFYRTNAQSRVLEDLLRSHSISYKIIGGVKFYERLEIKDMLGYLKVLINPADEVALKRIINTPARGIGKTTVEKIEALSIEQKITFYDAILAVAEQRLVHAGAVKKLRAFRTFMDLLRQDCQDLSISNTYLNVLDRTGYAQKLKEENTPEAQARIENLEEFDNAIRQFEKERGEEATLQNFLEEMALVSDADAIDASSDFVTLMTLHISKGLEYPYVFMVGLEQGLFPSARTFDSSDPEAIEEERRLCYVGMTRARKKLYMTYANTRRIWGQEQSHKRSQFLNEIPAEFVDSQTSIPKTSFVTRYQGAAPTPTYGSGPNSRQTLNDDPFPDYENESNEAHGQGFTKGMRVRHPTFGVGAV
ncbi:MAG: UvrD-helicase domain-containing protein, partial [Bdellovibrionales bacterium]|nr:UvrD-helicase domain-containing protein [Bdellovibrionales bacterium]